MKFALVNGEKKEATKGGRGICPCCGSKLIARCGEIKRNHWAHKSIHHCDKWWENETVWHRTWKGYFPIEWQEVVHFDEDGEKHIADVKTGENWVLEFQHSHIKPEERRSRNTFYKKLVWVVDGTRRIRDRPQFQQIISTSTPIDIENLIINRERRGTNTPKGVIRNLTISKVNFPEKSNLLKEWGNCDGPVLFDFESSLWFLLPNISKDAAYLWQYDRNYFIELHSTYGFDEVISRVIPAIRQRLFPRVKRRPRRNFRL